MAIAMVLAYPSRTVEVLRRARMQPTEQGTAGESIDWWATYQPERRAHEQRVSAESAGALHTETP